MNKKSAPRQNGGKTDTEKDVEKAAEALGKVLRGSKYWPADEVREIATTDVIPNYHEELSEADIAYLFVEEIKAKGRVCFAKTKTASHVERYFGDVDYVMIVNHVEWKGFNDDQRRALVDHELCHCLVETGDDGELKFKIRGHDLEEFKEIVERHGMWQPDVEEFASVVRQLELPIHAA